MYAFYATLHPYRHIVKYNKLLNIHWQNKNNNNNVSPYDILIYLNYIIIIHCV